MRTHSDAKPFVCPICSKVLAFLFGVLNEYYIYIIFALVLNQDKKKIVIPVERRSHSPCAEPHG